MRRGGCFSAQPGHAALRTTGRQIPRKGALRFLDRAPHDCDAARKAKEGQDLGFDCIKFKCTLTDPVVEWCQAIADSCGKGFSIILDPNERFDHAAHAGRIARELEAAGNVLCLEDPIPRWNMEAWVGLRRKIHIPLAMHVSLPYAEMGQMPQDAARADRKSTRLNSSHLGISYAV